MSGDYALYRYFDAADCLLYVGKSTNPGSRNRDHIRRSQWMQFAVRSAIERFDSPKALGAAERVAIKTEGPVFNRHYNDGRDAVVRLRSYLERAGRLDLMPAHLGIEACAPAKDPEALLDVLREILSAGTTDHAKVRLRAMAALEGYADLPRGGELDRVARLANVSRRCAYSAIEESAA